MPLRNVATTFTIEQQRLEINALAGDVNNIATGATNVGTAATANALAAGATGVDLTLSGTLTVNGSQTILNTATLEVEDKNIIIAKGSTTDAAASGGGITLKGADDKTLLYDQAGDEWQFNKPLRVEGSQGYASSASSLETTVTKAAFRVKGSTDSSDSIWMGVESTDANPYIQGSNGVGNNAKSLLLNPHGGKVGIGKAANAQRTLDIQTESNVNGFCLNSIGTPPNYHFDIRDDNAVVLRVDPSGNVGLGKETPGATLDIAATNSSSIGTHSFRLGAFGIRCEDVDNYNVWAIEKNYGGWGSAVVLQASGRVGIGTGTAGTELDALLTIKGDSNGDSVPSIRLKDGADSRECWMSNVSGDLYLANGGNDNAYHSRIRLMDGRAIYFDIDGASGSPFSVDANGVYDSKGKIRRIPRNEPTSGTPYTLVNSDMGKFISHGANVIMAANSTFATGDAITIYNYSGSTITIDASTNSATLHWTDGTTAATGDRTLAARGVATLLCVEGSNNTWVITGSLT